MIDTSSSQKLLMKTGLILIVIGHLNFISGALVNGTVLRHIANPQDTISLQYAISNIIPAISAILVGSLVYMKWRDWWKNQQVHLPVLLPSVARRACQRQAHSSAHMAQGPLDKLAPNQKSQMQIIITLTAIHYFKVRNRAKISYWF